MTSLKHYRVYIDRFNRYQGMVAEDDKRLEFWAGVNWECPDAFVLASEAESRIAELEANLYEGNCELEKQQRINSALEAQLEAVKKEAKHLTKTFRMPNIEHVSDCHNQAVDWLQALGGDDE